MSLVADLRTGTVDGAAPARWARAWLGLNRGHLLSLALAVLLMAAISLSFLADKLQRPGIPTVLAYDVLDAVVLFTITLLVWAAAVHGRDVHDRRRKRALLVALAVSSVLAAAILLPVREALGIREILWQLMDGKRDVPPMWLALISTTFNAGVFGLFFMAAIETMHRRAATGAAVLAARREQASVARQVLESRLAAMQAQVEPQFLFNTLVAIEALYRKDPAAAAANLDRLIQYLRVALPRLRDPGSTIAAEIDLVRAYLAVVTSLHGGRPALTVTVGPGCGEARFYPMLLLPLIQRAVRAEAAGLPESIRIGVQKIEGAVAIVTRIAHAGDCVEDEELARVRERLAALYGDRADLACSELDHGTTQFTLRIPAG